MTYAKRIVCLANSRKMGGRCVAGREVSGNGFGGWIRPVTSRSHAAIEPNERRYSNGNEPKLLDVIDIYFTRPAPHLHQTENHLIDASLRWQRRGAVPIVRLDDLLDDEPLLWLNGDSSAYGLNDRVHEEAISGLNTSLLLIKPQFPSIGIHTFPAPGGSFRRKIRSDFYYKKVHYNLGMTDPEVERAYQFRSDGVYRIEQAAYLCISLAEEPYEGRHYKLVASVITERPLS